MSDKLKIALIGNPNSGKSSVFNALTGLNQKVANFPGVTVEKKTGYGSLGSGADQIRARYLDLPGTYSLYPKSPDEKIPFRLLCDPHNEDHPEVTVVVADGTNLKRNLFLCSQVIDLNLPVVLAINMMDIVRSKNIVIDFEKLSSRLGVPVIAMNARKLEGIRELKAAILKAKPRESDDLIHIRGFAPEVINTIRETVRVNSDYNAFLVANNLDLIESFEIPEFKKEKIRKACAEFGFNPQQMQARETLERYKLITQIMNECVTLPEKSVQNSASYRIDSFLTHKVWGYVFFLFILFLIFQSVFAWATYPMELIDQGFAWMSGKLHSALPEGMINDLLVDGILAGLNGIVVFIPQIALLFFFVAILEDTGYMSRVSFLLDKMMRRFGMNGRSLIPLMSGVACAVPAIMSTRTIQNRKERLITILVTPLMSCSARLPVYTLLIALIVPSGYFYGFNIQGLILMGLYLIGFIAAIFAAWVMKKIIRSERKSFFVMELPTYKMPRWPTIGIQIIDKVKVFLFEAGKVIIAISVILWFLSSFGPYGVFDSIEKKYADAIESPVPDEDALRRLQSEKLENSYAGKLGHILEPVIRPLGFDWKIGIALITSFAAREVFVGTMSTIYSVGDESGNKMTVKEKMRSEKDPVTGKPRYDIATGISLMLFYAFAMQCMSTLAVVYRETRRIKYPIVQLLYMSGMAYLASFIAYQLLS